MAQKSVFCYRTPDFVNGLYVALGKTVDFAPSDGFFDFWTASNSPSALHLHFVDLWSKMLFFFNFFYALVGVGVPIGPYFHLPSSGLIVIVIVISLYSYMSGSNVKGGEIGQ